MWQPIVIEYLAAKARHADSERLMHRAGRTFDKLAKRCGDKRAYEIAGLALADERNLRAYQQERRAFDSLMGSLRGKPHHVRLKALGAIWCAELPAAANDPTGENTAGFLRPILRTWRGHENRRNCRLAEAAIKR
jgi:hypothetical protein